MIIKINIPFSNQFFWPISVLCYSPTLYTHYSRVLVHMFPLWTASWRLKKRKEKKPHRRTASAWCDANDNSHLLCASCSGLERISVASTATLQTHSVLQTSDLQDARTNTSIHMLTISIWPPHSEEWRQEARLKNSPRSSHSSDDCSGVLSPTILSVY